MPSATPRPLHKIFLPLVTHAAIPEVIVTLNKEAVPEQPVREGTTFATRTVAVPAALPTNVVFYLSAAADRLTPARVDDRLVMKVDGVEVFRHTYGRPPNDITANPSHPYIVVSEVVRVPDVVMQRIAGRTVTLEFVDVYGVYGSASPIFIVATQR